MPHLRIDPLSDLDLPLIGVTKRWGLIEPCFSFLKGGGVMFIEPGSPLFIFDIARTGSDDEHPDDVDNIYIAVNSLGQLVEIAGRFVCPLENDFVNLQEIMT